LSGIGVGRMTVESGEPVRGDDQEFVVEIVNVADFAARTGVRPANCVSFKAFMA